MDFEVAVKRSLQLVELMKLVKLKLCYSIFVHFEIENVAGLTGFGFNNFELQIGSEYYYS